MRRSSAGPKIWVALYSQVGVPHWVFPYPSPLKVITDCNHFDYLRGEGDSFRGLHRSNYPSIRAGMTRRGLLHTGRHKENKRPLDRVTSVRSTEYQVDMPYSKRQRNSEFARRVEPGFDQIRGCLFVQNATLPFVASLLSISAFFI